MHPYHGIIPKAKDPIAIKALTKKIVPGQVIRLDELYFQVDNATLNKNSFKILDELYAYLAKNQSVKLKSEVIQMEFLQKVMQIRTTERARRKAIISKKEYKPVSPSKGMASVTL